MGRGFSGSLSGEPDRARASFPGMPEAAAFGAALFLYSPLGGDGLRAAAAFRLGALLCAAGFAVRSALAAPGVLPVLSPSTPFSLRGKSAFLIQACLLAAALGAGLAWGAAVSSARRTETAAWTGVPSGEVVSYSGRLAADSRKTSSGSALYDIELERVESAFSGAEAKGGITLVAQGGPALSAGERVLVRGRLPEPGKAAFCDAEDIRGAGFPSAFEALRARARRGFIDRVSRIESSGGPLLVALMTGDKSGLPREEEDAFKKAGCAHILALSGQHIGILAALLGFLLIPLLGKKASLILSSAIVIAYLLVTGVQPSMLRSVLSYALSCLAWFLARKPRPSTVLAWTFLAASCLQPESVGSASFCLSYGATAGIVFFRERLDGFFSKWLPPPIAKGLGVSLAACAASAPLSIALFGTFNPSCVLSSTASGPLVSLMMWIGCGGSLACSVLPFPAAGKAFGVLLEIPYRLLRALIDLGASFPSLEFDAGAPRNAACAVLACVLLLLYAWKLYGPPRIRFPESPQEIHGRTRLRHAEKIRAEFPGVAERARKDSVALRG